LFLRYVIFSEKGEGRIFLSSFVSVKTRQRNHISLLALFHVLLFMFPIVTKSVHEHHDVCTYSYHTEKAATVHNTGNVCAICNFEFVSFIADQQQPVVVYLTGIPVLDSQAPESVLLQQFSSISLRAPPVT
jgi:hypothetical protein